MKAYIEKKLWTKTITLRTRKLIIEIISKFYFFLLFYITFLDERRWNNDNYRGRANFGVFDESSPLWGYKSIEYSLNSSYILNILGNVLLFLPFAPALYFITGKRISTIAGIFMIQYTTLFIECIQYLLNIGVFDIDDIISNLIGGIIGLLILNFFIKKIGLQHVNEY